MLILRCVLVSVDAMRTGAFLPEPAPGHAWIGTSAELWEWPWGWEQWVLPLAKVGKVTGAASAGVACAVHPPCAAWSDQKLGQALWKLTRFASFRAPKVRDPGSLWLSTPGETVLPQG